jgi:hypothetical protein
MAETFVEMPAEKAETRSQLIAAIILGLAATLTAIASYQSAVVDGDGQAGRAASGRTLSDANFFYSQSNQNYAGDQALFVAYAGAAKSGDQDLADYYQTLMRPEMSAAVDWWQKTDGADTPFDDIKGNPYKDDDADQAKQLEAQAKAENEGAEKADAKGDKFDLSVVLFALTLFFGGVATLLDRKEVTYGMLGISVLTLAFGLVIFLQGVSLPK